MEKVSLLSLIEQRKKYPVNPKDMESELNYIGSVLDISNSWAAMVLPSAYLLRRQGDIQALRDLIFDDWFLSGVLDLSAIWHPYASLPFVLLILERDKPENVLFSLYLGKKTFASHSRVRPTGSIGAQTIEAEYRAYIGLLEKFIETREPPKSPIAKFFTAESSDIDLDRLHGNYYDPELIEIERKIQLENFVLLSQIAQVLFPRKAKDSTSYILKPKDFQYPLDVQSLSQKGATNILLQKNDILVTRDLSRAYLILDPPEVKLTPSIFSVVIRPDTSVVAPEYLCLYFLGDVGKSYSLRYQTGSAIPSLSVRDIVQLPVILPDLATTQKSVDIFRSLYLTPQEDIGEFNKVLFSRVDTGNKEIQREFILEGLEKLRLAKMTLIRQLVRDDFQELGHCLRHGLHKSCLILCGSILEAILLDWLSEIEMVNYFEDVRAPTLFEMINRLYELDFLDDISKNQAHTIRDKRNLVHPRKYLNSGAKLTDEMCAKIVADLKQVLSQRNL